MQHDSEGFVIVNYRDLTVVHRLGMVSYPENGMLPPMPAWRTWEEANAEFQAQKKGQEAASKVDFCYEIVPLSVLRRFKISPLTKG